MFVALLFARYAPYARAGQNLHPRETTPLKSWDRQGRHRPVDPAIDSLAAQTPQDPLGGRDGNLGPPRRRPRAEVLHASEIQDAECGTPGGYPETKQTKFRSKKCYATSSCIQIRN